MRSAAQVYAMLGNETLWETARHCDAVLRDKGVPHAIAGGVAVCLHGYQRNTVDVDLLVRRDDTQSIREALEENGHEWDPGVREFRSQAGVPIQFLLAGDRAGDDAEVRFPDPADVASVTELEGLPVLSLAKLIESKIACGLGNLRRTHRDFADVVELIVVHDLDGSFARHLHESVRKPFRELVRNATGEKHP
jgi:hypothetical protein